jgi:hypothetical protein
MVKAGSFFLAPPQEAPGEEELTENQNKSSIHVPYS